MWAPTKIICAGFCYQFATSCTFLMMSNFSSVWFTVWSFCYLLAITSHVMRNILSSTAIRGLALLEWKGTSVWHSVVSIHPMFVCSGVGLENPEAQQPQGWRIPLGLLGQGLAAEICPRQQQASWRALWAAPALDTRHLSGDRVGLGCHLQMGLI